MQNIHSRRPLTRAGAALAAAAALATVAGLSSQPSAATAGAAPEATAPTAAAAGPVGSVTVKDSRTDMLGHGADIFSVRVAHRDGVRVVVQHRDLVRSWKPAASGTIYLDTDRATQGPDFALVAGLYSGTGYTMHPTDGWKIRYAAQVKGTYRMTLRYAVDRTVLELPRRTLGNPAAVRASVHTAGDDQQGHEIHDWLGRANSFTPWVARG